MRSIPEHGAGLLASAAGTQCEVHMHTPAQHPELLMNAQQHLDMQHQMLTEALRLPTGA